MSAIGGSIQDISIRGRLFPVGADVDANRKLGGFETELQANGDGSVRQIKTRMPWQIDGLSIEIDDDRADLEFLQEIADSKTYEDITITLASGVTYSGRGTVIGEVQGSSQSASASVTLGGPGKLEQQ